MTSPETGVSYEVEVTLGAGGFGTAYRASSDTGESVCLKVTTDASSWHREAYMAELLAGHPRVVAIQESFPIFRRGKTAYAVVMELAHGTVADVVEENPWSEHRVTRELKGLLSAVARLHASGAVHRDITPLNVFCCGPNLTLKLADFGIARHGFDKKGVRADMFAPWFVDTNIHGGVRERWAPTEDLWQVGQLAAVMLTGEVRAIGTREVRYLPCSDGMKVAIRRAIGGVQGQFLDARSMANALRPDIPMTFSRISSLDGKALLFTGPVGTGVTRREASILASRAGAFVLDKPSPSMDVLVVGEEATNLFAGAAGVKVLETLSLREQGYAVKMITGRHFRRLVGLPEW